MSRKGSVGYGDSVGTDLLLGQPPALAVRRFPLASRPHGRNLPRPDTGAGRPATTRPDFGDEMTAEKFLQLSEDDYGRSAAGLTNEGILFTGWLYSIHEGGQATIKCANGDIAYFEMPDWWLADPILRGRDDTTT